MFDGYEGGASTKDTVHRRQTGGQMATEVMLEGDLSMNTKKEKCLKKGKRKNKSKNKQNIHLLSSKLQLAGIKTCHAEVYADLLMFQAEIKYAQTSVKRPKTWVLLKQ